MSGENANPDPIDVEVGQRLRSFRLARGLSQHTLAEAVGITFQQVQKYERGDNRISASRLCHMAKTLKISPADLLPPRVLGKDQDAVALSLVVTSDLREIVDMVATMPAERQARIARIIAVLAEEGR